jgi:hypothetical protein
MTDTSAATMAFLGLLAVLFGFLSDDFYASIRAGALGKKSFQSGLAVCGFLASLPLCFALRLLTSWPVSDRACGVP